MDTYILECVNSSIVCDNTKKIESIGRHIYQTNDFYRLLSNFMEHPEFKCISIDYLSSIDNVKVFILYVNLYKKIGDHFPDFTGYQKIALIKTLIDTAESRRLICNEIHQVFNLSRTTSNTSNYKLASSCT